MTFPDTPLPVLVEMKIGSTWTNVTSDVLVRDEINITRGKQPEAGQAAPQICNLTVNNQGGKYSPRNPLSPYYGQIGRNTELRVAIETDPVFDAFSSNFGTSATLSQTHTPVGNPTGVVVFVWQYNTSAGEVSSVTYGGVAMDRKIFGLFTLGAKNAVGYMYFLNRGIPTGPQAVQINASTAVMRTIGIQTFTGGSHCEIDTQTQAYSNATPTNNPSMPITLSKRAYIVETLLADLADLTTVAPGFGYTQLAAQDLGTEIAQYQRVTVGVLAPGTYGANFSCGLCSWGIMAGAVRAVSYRFWGEVSSFPPKWDTSTNDAWVPLEASGVLRRLGQGTDPADTGLRSFIYPSTALYRYWPLSGAAGTKYSLDISPRWGTPVDYRVYSESAAGINYTYGTDMGSEFIGTGMAFYTSVSPAGPMRADIGLVAPYWAFDFVFSTLDATAGMGNFTVLLPSYDGAQWSFNFNAGVAQVTFDDGVIGPIGFLATGVLPQLQDLGPHHVRLKVLKSGVDSVFTLYIDGVSVSTGTQAAYTSQGVSLVRFLMVRSAGQERINLAHLAFFADATAESWPSALAMTQAMLGYAGEAAGTRIARICALSPVIPLATVGTLTDTVPMGPQHSESSLTQIRDAESTDLGILSEPRDALGLLYRTRTSMYNQTPKATISITALELAPPFEPVDDDQATRNIITAVRRDGDSYRLEDTTSRLSSSAPPLGIGPYRDEVTVNIQTDGQLPGLASWLLHLGTVDEARFPYINVDRASRAVVANPTLSAALMAVDLGDRMAITNATKANIYDDISVIVLGYNERLSPFGHTLVYNCTPESPYAVAVYGSGVGTGPDRYDAQGSQLGGALTSTATTFTAVQSGSNPTLWTNAAGEFPFDIRVGGERMTVTNITSANPPQTFTVTRSVNGVVKSHSAGAEIRLWKTPRYAL